MKYPALVLRIRAMCIDLIVFVFLFWAVFLLIWKVQFSNDSLKIVVLSVPLLLFEPMCMSISGSTIGQHLVGIKVASRKTGKNLFILRAILRYVVKVVVGFYSVITMAVTHRRQSFHDVVSGSVVLFKDDARAPERYILRENVNDDRVKPGILRRLAVILLYLFLVNIVFGFLSLFLAPAECWGGGPCTESREMRVVLASIAFIGSVLLILVLGCLCKLPGAYYKKTPTQQ